MAVLISTTQATQVRKLSQPGKSLLAEPCMSDPNVANNEISTQDLLLYLILFFFILRFAVYTELIIL